MSSDANLSRQDADARAYAKAWRQAEPQLETERLRALRQLTEKESAQHFARLLCLTAAYPIRNSSGLVEQQRLFSKLRDSNS